MKTINNNNNQKIVCNQSIAKSLFVPMLISLVTCLATYIVSSSTSFGHFSNYNSNFCRYWIITGHKILQILTVINFTLRLYWHQGSGEWSEEFQCIQMELELKKLINSAIEYVILNGYFFFKLHCKIEHWKFDLLHGYLLCFSPMSM